MRRHAVRTLVARGDLARAGAVALAGKDWPLLAEVAERLVVATVLVHPSDVARRWLSQLPQSERGRPGLVLLAAADRLQRDCADGSVDALLDRCVPRLAGTSRSAALAIGVVAAVARHDLGRLDGLANRPPTMTRPVARPVSAPGPLGSSWRAIPTPHSTSWRPGRAGVAGRWYDRRAAGGEPGPDSLPAARRPARGRGGGRPVRARDLGDEHLRHALALTRWLAGDPRDFVRPSQVEEYAGACVGGTSRDRVLGAFAHASLAASWGQVSPPARRETATLSLPDAAPRDAAFLTNARAAMAVAAHREAEAVACFDAFLALHPPQPGAAERHLRRNLALGYVLEPRLRALGTLRHWGRRNGRHAGRPGCWSPSATTRDDVEPDLDPELVFTGLPLPWSVELAARLRQRECPAGARLAAWLVDRVGAPVRAELRRLAAVPATATGAPLCSRRYPSRLTGRSPSPFSGRTLCGTATSPSTPACGAAGSGSCCSSWCSNAASPATGSSTSSGPTSIRRPGRGTSG